MATTGERFALSRAPARVVSLAPVPLSLPVHPGPAIGWATIMLAIANLGRIPVLATGSRTAAIVVNDLAVAALVGLCLVAALLRRSLWIDSVTAIALLFAGIGFVSAASGIWRIGYTPGEVAIGLTYLARWLMYLGVYVFVTNNVRWGQVDDIWGMLLKVMIVFSAFGVFQSIFLPGFAQIVYPDSVAYVDWDPQGHRLVSTVLEPNVAASMISLVLLIQLAQISYGARIPMWQPALFLLALAMTISRSGALGLMAGLVVIVVARGISMRLMRMFALIGFLSLALIPRLIAFAQEYGKFEVGSGTSAGARIMSWLSAIEAIRDFPLIGVGFNTFGFYRAQLGDKLSGASSYGADGGLLFAAAMTGLVGLACYLWMIAALVRRSRRVWRDEGNTPSHRGLAAGVAAGVVAVCVQSLFVNSIFTTFVMEIMWLTWGLVFVIARGRRETAPS